MITDPFHSAHCGRELILHSHTRSLYIIPSSHYCITSLNATMGCWEWMCTFVRAKCREKNPRSAHFQRRQPVFVIFSKQTNTQTGRTETQNLIKEWKRECSRPGGCRVSFPLFCKRHALRLPFHRARPVKRIKGRSLCAAGIHTNTFTRRTFLKEEASREIKFCILSASAWNEGKQKRLALTEIYRVRKVLHDRHSTPK